MRWSAGPPERTATCSYFKREADGTVTKTQKSIVRTNCMDCLDRTNVVQSMLARRFLHQQLADMGIFDPKEQISEHRAFEIIFRNSAFQRGPKISGDHWLTRLPCFTGGCARTQCGRTTRTP